MNYLPIFTRIAKQYSIKLVLEAIYLSGVSRLIPTAAGHGVIFTLHHVRPARDFEFEPNGHLSVTPEFLDEALTTARNAGLHPVRLEDLPDMLNNPSDKQRLFCVTLDDGYRDNEKYAAPVFRKHKVPYTIFVTPGFVNRTRTIWWETAEALTRKATSFSFDFGNGTELVKAHSISEKWIAFERLAAFLQLRDEDEAIAAIDRAALVNLVDGRQIVDDEIMTAAELRKLANGDPLVALGAHTLTHPNLARVNLTRLKSELSDPIINIETYCGRSPRTLAYPYGGRHAVGAREAVVAAEAGYKVAVTTQPGVLKKDSMINRTMLPRVSLNGYFQRARYVHALVSGVPFKLMKRYIM